MANETTSKRLKREREQRLVGYIKKKLTSHEIADREGMEADYVRKTRNDLAERLGLTVEESKREPVPFGLTAATRQLRLELGNMLYNLSQRSKMHDLEIARDVGIPVRHQKVANHGKEPNYNWKLSQIERMARTMQVDPTKLLVKAMRRELVKQAGNRRVGELVEEWITEANNGII